MCDEHLYNDRKSNEEIAFDDTEVSTVTNQRRKNMFREHFVSIRLTALLCLLTLCACATGTQPEVRTSASEQTEQTAQAKEEIEAHKKLNAIIEEAKKSGESKVNVFLDEKTGVVQEMDYVRLTYTARLQDGSFIRLLNPATVLNRQAYTIDFEPKTIEGTLLAGAPQSLMGIGSRIMSMQAGQSKHIVLEPEDAFGYRSNQKLRSYPSKRVLEKIMKLPPKDYYNYFKSFPKKGATIQYNNYMKAEVIELKEKEVVVKLLAKDGMTFEEEYGVTRISAPSDSDDIVLTLEIKPGTSFNGGTVVEVRDDEFVVDHNHPLAGERIDVDLTIEEIIKPGTFGNERLEWVKDYSQGLEEAKDRQKPMVLFLYADWCKWCKRMAGTTFEDPWVRFFKDRYVWVKINSDKEREYMEEFGQRGFPMTVLLTSDGDVMKKLSGFKDADALRLEFLDALNSTLISRGMNVDRVR